MIRQAVRSLHRSLHKGSTTKSRLARLQTRKMTESKVQEKFLKAQNSLGEVLNEFGSSGWDVLWQKKITPWDAKKLGSAPALVKLVNEGKIPTGRILVPGCGSGSDLITLAAPDRQVFGLELSPTAAKAAEQTLAERQLDPKFASVIVGDFFELDPTQKFNCIFDYTFMAALPVDYRPRWAAKMRDLVSDGGILITLMFPVGEFAGGPPFASTPQEYHNLLVPLGFKCEMSESVNESFPSRQGREHIAIWRKISN